MKVWLRRDVHVVQSGASLVVLDLLADAYSMIPVPAGAGPVKVAPGFIETDDPPIAQAFVEAGLTIHGPAPALPEAPATEPEASAGWSARPSALRDLTGRSVEAPRLRDGLDAARALVLSSCRFRSWTLARLVGSVRAGRHLSPPSPDASEAALRRAAGFARLLIWWPWQGECLFRSYALLAFMRLGGHQAAWVFGVRTRPFLAHCWVQVGDVVLNDELERLKAFQPILQV